MLWIASRQFYTFHMFIIIAMKVGFLSAVQKIKNACSHLCNTEENSVPDWSHDGSSNSTTNLLLWLKRSNHYIPLHPHFMYVLLYIQQFNTVSLLFEIIQFTKEDRSFYQGIFATWQLHSSICLSQEHIYYACLEWREYTCDMLPFMTIVLYTVFPM